MLRNTTSRRLFSGSKLFQVMMTTLMVMILLLLISIFQHRESELNNSKAEFKFNSENEKKVQEIISKYPSQYKKAAMIPLLELAQRQNSNWLPISAMNHVAKILEVPKMRVYEVATFYTMFNRDPVGKYFVQVCTTTPCELCGASKVVEALKEEIGLKNVGETSKDGIFTLVEVECAGACVNAPVLAINDDYYVTTRV